MSVLLTNIPHVAMAETATQMIPTTAVVDEMTRARAVERISAHLNRAEIRTALEKRGVSAEEVTARLASLSDQELRQFATQMDRAHYGGDPSGILIVIVLVLLIIFLVKRI